MADLVVGARFEVKSNELVAAAKASEEQLAKLNAAAKNAEAAVEAALSPPAGGDALAKQISATAVAIDASGSRVVGLLGNMRSGMLSLQAAGVNAFQALAAGMNPLHIVMMEGAQVAGALVQGGMLPLAASIATKVLPVVAGLTAAYVLLSRSEDELAASEARLKQVLEAKTGALERDKESAATRLANVRAQVEANRREAESIVAKIEALRAEAVAKANIEAGMAAGNVTPEIAAAIERRAGAPFDAALARARAAIAGKYYEALPYDDALIRWQRADDAARAAERERLDREFKRRFNPDPMTGGTARRAPSAGERDFVREAEAAIKAAQAIEEYQNATADLIAKMEAERSGRRETIAQIELEAQLRKRYGADAVQAYQEQIRAAAAERAAAEQNRKQWEVTTKFIDGTANAIGDALQRSLLAPLEEGGLKMKNLENIWLGVVKSILAEALKLTVINPILNGLFGGTRDSAFGGGGIGGILGQLLGGFVKGFGGGFGGISGGAGFDTISLFHRGGIVGDAAAPARSVSPALFANAPRAHQGLQLGPRERPVIAMEGEAIFTPRQMQNADRLFRSAAAPPVININIHDQRGAGAPPVETRARRGAGGRIDIDVIVKNSLKRAFSDGSMDRIVELRWGLPVKGVRD